MSPKSSTAPSVPTAEGGAPQWRSEKIFPRHLERLAAVYVRQSTPQQVVRHQESAAVQYRLKLRAQELGWPEDRILVIDDDLGKSAASTEGRLGFQRLVAEVTLDHVGIIFGIEMSRLARSCKDWYQLLEVCSVFGTLIADLDGVYDPSQYNDRLLLGLKGTMSEAELHILVQRMSQGKLNKARRGELLFNLPFGYVRRPAGEVAFDPDEQAQDVVRLIFRKFEELGRLNGILQFLVRHDVKLPIRGREGTAKGELEWRRPSRATLRNALTHPMYAGAYTYGRRAVDPRRKVAGRSSTGRTVVSPKDCQVFLKDHFPAYISWDQYERNQERLKANRALSEAIGAPKHGPSLLSGLIVCGRCGWRMNVNYSGQSGKHRYTCSGRWMHYGEDRCQSLAGASLDSFVSEQALKALEPASLELSLEVAQNIESQRQELDQIWTKRMERARYETDRAARQYRHVEPENRLVARQLEREWERKLKEQRSVEEDHDRFLREQPRVLSQQEREAIRSLAADIPALWASPKTMPGDRKEILRQVIDRVIVELDGESERVKIRIEWAGGQQTQHEIVRPVARLEQLSYWPQLAARLRELVAEGLSAREIARRLNAEEWRPPKRCERFNENGVRTLIYRHGLRRRWSRPPDLSSLGPHEWWIPDLARELDMPPVTLYSWLRRGWTKARRTAQVRWAVWADASELERIRQLRSIPHGERARQRWTKTQSR